MRFNETDLNVSTNIGITVIIDINGITTNNYRSIAMGLFTCRLFTSNCREFPIVLMITTVLRYVCEDEVFTS